MIPVLLLPLVSTATVVQRLICGGPHWHFVPMKFQECQSVSVCNSVGTHTDIAL
jgi:hypothetical protein